MTYPGYLDTLGMWEATAGLPEQLDVARERSIAALQHYPLPVPERIRAVAIFGAGVSGLAAEAVAAYGAPQARIPIVVGHGYDVPHWIGPDTLVLAVSHSGTTRETWAAAETALQREASLIVISGGGALKDLAESAGVPYLPTPGELPASRVALGALVASLAMALEKVGVLTDVDNALRSSQQVLSRRRDALLKPDNPAEHVARLIGRTIPLMYGSSGVTAVAAARWKTQINENAKTPAFWASLPELAHNEVAGWGQHGDITRQVLTLITLRHHHELPAIARLFAAAVEVTDEVMGNVIPVWAEGDNPLGCFLDLALFGDFVSLQVAGGEQIDPGPEPAVSDMSALDPTSG